MAEIALFFDGISGWWVLVCLLFGTGMAWLLYRRSGALSVPLRRLLFISRALVISLLAFLLLSPFIKTTTYVQEKPVVVLAQDNSSSILLDQERASFYTRELPGKLRELEQKLSGDYDVKAWHFSNVPGSGFTDQYTGKQTDISKVIREIGNRYQGLNLGAVVLLTDGIYNKGSNPFYAAQNIPAPFYTVALGDTTRRRDALVAGVDHNQIVYLDNDFRIEVQVNAFGYSGQKSLLKVSLNGETQARKEITINRDDFYTTVPVDLTAAKAGTRKYLIELEPLDGEATTANNRKEIFIDVLDNQEQVLLLAAGPHPDLGAIRQAMEARRNYEVDIRYTGDPDPGDLKKYSLVVFHNLPSGRDDLSPVFKQLEQLNIPYWMILGAQTNLRQLNALSAARIGGDGLPLKFRDIQGNVNEVYPVSNGEFGLFNLEENAFQALGEMPPLLVPYASVSKEQHGVDLLKDLMMYFGSGQARSAWLLGEGLWRWRLFDYRLHESHEQVDELILQTVRYLTSANDKRRFRVNLPRNIFPENEPVTFTAELYNESYEPVTRPEVHMRISDQQGRNYPFTFSAKGSAYSLNAGILPPGEYTFTASTVLGGEKHTAGGKFIVEELHVESTVTHADHQLLYNMASGSGGRMLYPAETDSLYEWITQKEEIAAMALPEEQYQELISIRWIFLLVLLLLGMEWFTRRRSGLY